MDHLNASQIIHYSIPQTQIIIIIVTGTPTSSLAMHSTIDACIGAVNAAMDKYGDVYMFPDPYNFKTPPTRPTGLEIGASSTMIPGLKWMDLFKVLHAVEQIMLQRALYKEMHVKMYDDPSGVEMGVVDLHKSSAIDLAEMDGLA